MKLDDLDFLEQTRPEYNFINDDAKNSVGYITDDEDDEIMEHKDYGKLYTDSSDEYKQLILEDHCDGRPVYEWQVPYGLHQVYGYQNGVYTAVDIICNEEKLENIDMKWKVNIGDTTNGIMLINENTQQEICLVEQSNAYDVIKNWSPNTVVVKYLLHSLLFYPCTQYIYFLYTFLRSNVEQKSY